MRLNIILALFVAMLLAMCSSLSPAYAHDRGDFLPCAQLDKCTWLTAQVLQRGYGLYALDQRGQTFEAPAGTARQEIASIVAAWTAKTHIPFYEVPLNQTYDLLWAFPDVWTYGDGAAGIAWYGLAPARIDINWRLPYYSFKTTYGHETGHAGMSIEEDQYIHPLTCAPDRKWTVMSCGTLLSEPQNYDRDVAWNVWIPDQPSILNWSCDNAWCSVSYNNLRRSSVGCVPFSGSAILGTPSSEADNFCGHYNRTLDNAIRVAIFYRDNGGEWQWAGNVCGAAFDYCYGPAPSSNGLVGRGFERQFWCRNGSREFAIHPENALAASYPAIFGGVGFLSGDFAIAGSC